MSVDFLPRRVKPGEAITASAFNALLDELRRLGSLNAGNGLSLRSGPSGVTLGVSLPDFGPYSAVVSTAITAAPDADTLGEGEATLRIRNGADLTDGDSGVTVYSNFSVEIPVGTRIEVLPDADAYKLVGADCPTA